MTYTPQAGDEGFGLLKAALRDYLRADTTITSELPGGVNGFLDEGFMTAETPTPAVMFATVGDGQSAAVREQSLVRFIVYVVDRGRGLSKVERILHRVRRRINDTGAALSYLTFPTNTGLVVEHIEASGSSSSASLPAWKAEARGVYVFLIVRGLEATY
jgi:hypothetical protein